MKPASIKDIASKANVSITTVSFILNGKAEKMRISKAVIERVQAVIKEFEFKPNQIARSLRTGNTKTIGLIVEDISNPFFASIARKIEDKAYKKGYKISYSSTENDVAKAKDLIIAAIEQALKNSTIGYLTLPDPSTYRYVIGQGGSKVNSIRKATGCKITVPRDQARDEGIEISGSADGIEKAKDLVLDAVKEGKSGGNGRA